MLSTMLARNFIKKVYSTIQKSNMSSLHSSVDVLGIPYGRGQRKDGVDKAPIRIRETGVIKGLSELGLRIKDHGDLNFSEVIVDDNSSFGIPNPRASGLAMKKIAESVAAITKENDTTFLSLGGDHSVAIGTLAGHLTSRPGLKIVWVDAHADINPPLSSDSGNIHGMVLSFLIHETRELIPPVAGFEWIKPCLHAKDITYIGLRDVDIAEKVIIEKHGIKCYSMFDVEKMGINTIMKEIVNGFGKDDKIHMSFDIDCLDPSLSPSTGTPVSGGLTLREGMYIAGELANTGKLRGVDLVEVNTYVGDKEDAAKTLKTAGDIIESCFGKRKMNSFPEGYVLKKP